LEFIVSVGSTPRGTVPESHAFVTFVLFVVSGLEINGVSPAESKP